MNPPDSPTPDRASALVSELERVRRQEAAFRARSIQESLENRKTIKDQTAELKRIHKWAAERDAYIHELHLAREADKRELVQAYADLESFVFRLRDAEESAASARSALDAMRGTWNWKLAERMRHLPSGEPAFGTPGAPPSFDPVPGARFTYFLQTSPFRLYRGRDFTILGWAYPEDGSEVLEVRSRVDGRPFPGTYGLEEPEVTARLGAQAKNPRPGLRLPFETPAGRHHLSLEARIEGAGWVSFLTTPIWVDHASLRSEPAAGA